MVDAWTGNTVWSFTQSQMMPVAATPAMLDVGAVNSSRQDSDGFFDTATVGDMGGQVWLLRFDKPGPRDQNGAAMWNGARAFEMAKGESLQKKQPFYSLLANTLQPETGWLRTFGGTGDRNHLLVREEQGCSPSNLLTCAHLSCNANLVVNTNVNGRTTRRSLTMTNGAISQFNVAPSGSASTQCVGARLDMTITSMSCAAGGNTPWGGLSTQSTCEASRDQTSLACTSVDANMNVRSAPQPVTNVPKNRFYGIHTYGGTRRFSNSVEAATFDTRRYTDPEAEGDEARRLTNVTLPDNPGGTASADLKRASPNSPGWLIQYDAADERTAAGAAVLGGIVYWPSLKVSPSPQTCSVAPHTSRSWQADYVTGAPDQAQSYKTATGFLQRKSRQASTPPPEPAAIVSLSKTGEVRYGVSVMEPGQKPVQETLRSKDDVVSDVYWLEVPGALHQCRHVDKNACE
jgi:type IV pilus assembly protein PilY1